jgi:hypothetical protein
MIYQLAIILSFLPADTTGETIAGEPDLAALLILKMGFWFRAMARGANHR